MKQRMIKELEKWDNHEQFSAEEVAKIYLEYAKLTKNYSAAIREVQTKLQILDEDFEMMHDHDPIHHMETRIKSIDSILGKLERKGLEVSLESITENLTDIAGVRVICHYVEDIYAVADLLKSHADVEVVKETDYIKTPKANGYRSLHLVVKIPVYFVDGMVKMPVEIQIRTMAMNFWASLEHKLRYKSDGAIPKFIADELKECSEIIAATDLKMQRIHSFLEDIGGNVTLK